MSLIMSIESSCDDSSIALTNIKNRKLILHKKISQETEHTRYGGVVPELASRLHAVALPVLLESVKPYISDISAVAVTNEPGLSVTLHEGVIMAKVFAVFRDIPLIPVHHLKGHIYSLFIEKETFFPMLILLISGGHTQIIRAESIRDMRIEATSMDDSAGESYDKVAKMMGFGYPGGPVIEKLAAKGDPERFDLPVPLRNSPLTAFSFSGLKNAVRLCIESLGGADAMSEKDQADLSASFQKAVIMHLIQKTKKIFKQDTIKDFAIVGGASSNMSIRKSFRDLCTEYGKDLHTAKLKYCSDNAAMIGRYGVDALECGLICKPSHIKVAASKKLNIGDKF